MSMKSNWKLCPRFWVNETNCQFLDVGINKNSQWKDVIKSNPCRKVMFCLQRDPSGAASCHGCGSKISKFALRFGIPERDVRGPCGVIPRFYHASFHHFTPNLPWMKTELKKLCSAPESVKDAIVDQKEGDMEKASGDPITDEWIQYRRIVHHTLQEMPSYQAENAEQKSCSRILTRRAFLTDIDPLMKDDTTKESAIESAFASEASDTIIEWAKTIANEIKSTNPGECPNRCGAFWATRLSDNLLAAAILWIFRKGNPAFEDIDRLDEFPLIRRSTSENLNKTITPKERTNEEALVSIKPENLFQATTMPPIVLDEIEVSVHGHASFNWSRQSCPLVNK